MLTKKQQIKLVLLTQDPKFGQLLADAIEIWKSENVFPTFNWMGFDVEEGKYVLSKQFPKKGCCLVGAALIGKERKFGFLASDNLPGYFNCSKDEAFFIQLGFDRDEDLEMYSDFSKEAYDFGKQVAEIVNPINFNNLV